MANMNYEIKAKYEVQENDGRCAYCGEAAATLKKDYVPRARHLDIFQGKPIVVWACQRCINRLNNIQRIVPTNTITFDQRLECITGRKRLKTPVIMIKAGDHAGKLVPNGALFDNEWVYVVNDRFPIEDLVKVQPILACLMQFGHTQFALDCLEFYSEHGHISGTTYDVLKARINDL